ncbi:MAG: AMP-binding protein [Acidimicrobiales bacterium]
MDYEATLRSFSWDDAAAALDGLPGGRGLNIAHEAVDRHATGERAAHVALRFLHQGEAPHDVTYAALAALTNRFANVLGQLGVSRGDRVFSLCGRVPELYVSALGTLKAGAVFCPLYSAFGPDPIRQRLDRGDGAVLVTTEALYRKKVSALRADLPNLRHVLLIDGTDETPGTESLGALMDAASDAYEIAPTSPDDMALLHFTSGTTGVPKGVVHVHGAVVAHHATSRFALDLHPDDVFWCTADPGWVTGTSYGIIAPLTHGLTTVVDSRGSSTPSGGTARSRSSGSPSGTPRRPRSGC